MLARASNLPSRTSARPVNRRTVPWRDIGLVAVHSQGQIRWFDGRMRTCSSGMAVVLATEQVSSRLPSRLDSWVSARIR